MPQIKRLRDGSDVFGGHSNILGIKSAFPDFPLVGIDFFANLETPNACSKCRPPSRPLPAPHNKKTRSTQRPPAGAPVRIPTPNPGSVQRDENLATINWGYLKGVDFQHLRSAKAIDGSRSHRTRNLGWHRGEVLSGDTRSKHGQGSGPRPSWKSLVDSRNLFFPEMQLASAGIFHGVFRRGSFVNG